tara:strand:+ start:593 stop:1180 length:588 start_codon:yes stop_codon:yes gene_type:complete
MRKFIAIIFLSIFFIIPSLADDISDYEIEGISIGDSALDFFSKEEIKKSYKTSYPKSDDYEGYEIPKNLSKIKFSTYDSITVTWKKIDKEKKIVAITGIKLYPNKLKQCLKKRDKTVEEIKKVANYKNEDQYEMSYGKGSDSIGYVVDLKIQDGSIRIWCTDWDSKTEREKNWEDDFNVSIERKEFIYWLDNIAY